MTKGKKKSLLHDLGCTKFYCALTLQHKYLQLRDRKDPVLGKKKYI